MIDWSKMPCSCIFKPNGKKSYLCNRCRNLTIHPKPFCLVDKRNAPASNSITQYTPYYYEEHIKQAVQLLKEEIEWCNTGKPKIGMITIEQIDEIFGEALTK